MGDKIYLCGNVDCLSREDMRLGETVLNTCNAEYSCACKREYVFIIVPCGERL